MPCGKVKVFDLPREQRDEPGSTLAVQAVPDVRLAHAPDRETYLALCRPEEDFWDSIQESLGILGKRRSAVRITLVEGYNDFEPASYARMVQDSGAAFVEVKGYMFLGYSRKRLQRENMPSFAHVKKFAEEIASISGYRFRDENQASRVVCLEREG